MAHPHLTLRPGHPDPSTATDAEVQAALAAADGTKEDRHFVTALARGLAVLACAGLLVAAELARRPFGARVPLLARRSAIAVRRSAVTCLTNSSGGVTWACALPSASPSNSATGIHSVQVRLMANARRCATWRTERED